MAAGDHDLNLLEPLRALLEEVNVTRAGERVRMSQSFMSIVLGRLREEFDDELLVRVGRDYELTPFARQLLPQVQSVLPLVRRALGIDQDFERNTTNRTISIMMTDYSTMRLQPAIASVLADAPGIRVNILPFPELPMESKRDLQTHDFVVSVPGIGIDGPNLQLFVEDYVCLLDAGNPASSQGELSLDQFESMAQAVAQLGRFHSTPANRRLRELGIGLRERRVLTFSTLSLPSVVAGTELVAVVPRGLAERLGPSTGTVGVEPPFERIELDVRLWWHKSYDADPAHAWFRDRLADAMRHQSPPTLHGLRP